MNHKGNHAFMKSIGLKKATAEWRKTSEIIRSYNAWMFSQLASGRAITIFGVGTIAGSFRMGRNIARKDYTIVQPDTYSMKLRLAPRLKEAVRALATTPSENHYKLTTKDGHYEKSYRLFGRDISGLDHDRPGHRSDHSQGEGSTPEECAHHVDQRTAGSHEGPDGAGRDAETLQPAGRPGAICAIHSRSSGEA